jgi:hypothetical protein
LTQTAKDAIVAYFSFGRSNVLIKAPIKPERIIIITIFSDLISTEDEKIT